MMEALLFAAVALVSILAVYVIGAAFDERD
jgi:hypothetical protein